MRITVFTILLALLAGCDAKHCIRVEGGYLGGDGAIQYCYDATSSEDEEAPVLSDEDGGKNYLVTEDQIDDLLNMIEELDVPDPEEIFTSASVDSSFTRLIKKLEKHRRE